MSTFILPSETFQVRLFGIEPHVDRRASKNRAFTVMTFRTHTAKSTQSPFEGIDPHLPSSFKKRAVILWCGNIYALSYLLLGIL